MAIGRSTFYDMPDARARDLTIVAEMKTICDEFEAYGYRRVDAELRHRGVVVNAKKIRRLMREHALNPKQRWCFVATTDSDHNYPIFPNLAKNMKLDGPNQLWVSDITYVTIATGFVYLAAPAAMVLRAVPARAESIALLECPPRTAPGGRWRASPPELPLWECRDPSARCAGPCRTGARCARESRAMSSCHGCCPASLRRPAAIPRVSPPARSLSARNRGDGRASIRAGACHFLETADRLQNRCWSDRRAARRS